MHNWAGNVEFGWAGERAPRGVAELQDVVARSPRVKAVGSRHSFSTAADTDGIAISTRELGLLPEIDEEHRLVAAPGAATYAELGAFLQGHGWALGNLGSLPHISVAGACATGTHGSGVDNACLAAAVRAVELVRADGELVRVDASDPDFGAMPLNLGALGVVTRLWLEIEPTYEVRQHVVLDVPTHAVATDTVALLSAAYSVSVFDTFARPDAVDSVWFKQRSADRTDPLAWGGVHAPGPVHPVPGVDAVSATTQAGVAGPWLDRLPHFRTDHVPSVGVELQSELMVPLAVAGDAYAAVRRLAASVAPVLQVFEMRAIAADDLWLSPFRDRASAAMHFTWIADLARVHPVLDAVEEALLPLGARPHWGKVVARPDRWTPGAPDPYVARFRDLAQRLDPERCFTNAFLAERGVR